MALSDDDVTEESFMAHFGEDRGARIDIDNSTFSNSHFCKGMISYRPITNISFTDQPNYLQFNLQKNRTKE